MKMEKITLDFYGTFRNGSKTKVVVFLIGQQILISQLVLWNIIDGCAAGRFVGTQTLAKRTPWLRVHLGCAMRIEGLWEHKPWLIGDTNLD